MYLYGFGNYHQTEAIEGALPKMQNAPQQCNLGLYAEQLSGSAFTKARHNNLHTWLYRILPSVTQGSYQRYEKQLIDSYAQHQSPNPMRWSPIVNRRNISTDFIDGLYHLAGNGCAHIFLYYCNQSMQDKFFCDYDGEWLIVPYEGALLIDTELGQLSVSPGVIAVIPRGIHFKISLESSEAKGYLCENKGAPLTLPHLGPLGANALANPRHFEYPVASYETETRKSTLICKYLDELWFAVSDHSPLNVVAWHGNYAPYRYDLALFNTIDTVSYDHPDPSIFTVLTSESTTPGVANLDFVIFPPRWMVAEHTFRPPYFHRNIMSELMGLIYGVYDAKKEGFVPGGVSIHNGMTPHGPDNQSYQREIKKTLKPEYIDSLAFMFESNQAWKVTTQSLIHPSLQKDYALCWSGFVPHFNEL